jgi:hypothetical protein
MVCSSCGDVLQPNATSCINMSCADYQRPFTAEERDATRPRPPVPTAPMRPLDGWANATVVCVAVTALSSAIAIPLSGLGDPAPLPPAWAAIDLAILAVGVVAAGCFITWLFRARRNLDALPSANPFWPKSWSIGVWFIPAGNAAMPALVMSDIATETVADRDDPRRHQMVRLARWFWIGVVVTTFLLYVVVDRRILAPPVVLYLPTGDVSLPSPDVAHPASARLLWLTAACVLASSVACIAFVRRLTALQLLRFQPEPIAA